MEPLITPPKLQRGDQILAIAPSNYGDEMPGWIFERAKERLALLGLKLVKSKNFDAKPDSLKRAPVQGRVDDVHQGFFDPAYAGIICMTGGASSIMLLPHLDYEKIRAHPKPLWGHSDIAALLAAIHAKSRIVTYYGPSVFNLGQRYDPSDYSLKSVVKNLIKSEPFEMTFPRHYTDGNVTGAIEDVREIRNTGLDVIVGGKAEGRIWGGNLHTLSRQYGTEYFPSLEDSILFLESSGDLECFALAGHFVKLGLVPGIETVRGLVLGKFQAKSDMTRQRIVDMVIGSDFLPGGIPIVINADIGHTIPKMMFPIGGHCKIDAEGRNVKITIKP